MPTYSYRCPACGREYDRMQKMSDTALKKCPDCGTPGERQISAGIGFVFKGSGFYETDYKRKGETRTKYETGDSVNQETAASSNSNAGDSKGSGPEKPKTTDKSKPKAKAKTGDGS